MIELLNASRTIPESGRPHEILAETSVVFGQRERVGILAARGTGKSVIARLLSGIERPDTGHVIRTGRVSWPIGFAGTLHPELTVFENIVFAARILGEDPYEFIAFCDQFARLGQKVQAPMKTLSPAKRAAVGFCISVSVACDTYIADEAVGFGRGAEQEMSEAFLELRLEQAGLVFLSSNPKQISKFCQRTFVLLHGHLVACDDVETGFQALLETQKFSAVDGKGTHNE